jgi:ligand-binding sensor domain-containing protein/signal transduction histidine kinase
MFCLALSALALDPARALSQYNCRTWTRQNGLPADGVAAITQTRDGYIWLGTSLGLISFDGIDFKLADMSAVPSPIVTSLSAAARGGLWFGAQRGGVGFCDGKTVSRLPGWPAEELNVRSIWEGRQGDLWIGAETKLARLRGGKVYEEIVTNQPSGIDPYDARGLFEDSQGRLWIATTHQGLYYLQNGVAHRLYADDAAGPEMHCVVEDQEGNIWAGTDKGPLRWDKNLRPFPFTTPWWPVRSMLADRRGVLWMGTINGGLFRYKNGEAEQFTQADGLADDVVLSLAEDANGTLWIGTRSGVSELADIKIPTYGRREGLPAKINVDVCASRLGGIWVGTSEGLGYFNVTNLSYWQIPTLTNDYISRVFEASNGTVYVIDGSHRVQTIENNQSVATNSPDGWPTAFTEDSQSPIIAIYGRLYRIRNRRFEPVSFRGIEPVLGRVFNLAVTHDDATLVACDFGICRIQGGVFRFWGKSDGLPDSKVTSLCEDGEGTIWAGTEKGLGRIQKGAASAVTQNEGLFDNLIYALAPDREGNLWMDSSRGFIKASLRNLNAVADRKAPRLQCAGFGAPDGVKTAERFQQQFTGCRTTDGRIWFPTAQGLAMVDARRLTVDATPPTACLRSIRVNGREWPRTDAAVIPPGRGELEFQYAGLNYLAPLKIRYRYRLSGYDKDWVEAGERRAAFYMNLRPGNYQFCVQACNEDGVWNQAGAATSITLLPRFYQTTWFKAWSVIVLAGLLVLAGRIAVTRIDRKQRRLQEDRDKLEAKVEERTRELRGEIEERKRMELEVARVHRELVDASRLAGKAEVASSVLHNVGNVLTSVNTSATLLRDRVRERNVSDIAQIGRLLTEHRHDLAAFLGAEGRTELMIKFVHGLSTEMEKEQAFLLSELTGLTKNVDHIKKIVVMQQTNARAAAVAEKESLPALAEDALRIQAAALESAGVRVLRQFEPIPEVMVDRHKTLQILVNLIANSQQALAAVDSRERVLTVRIQPNGGQCVHIAVTDNGMGIPAQNLNRIFAHGFTTRKDGHGFGLHSGFLAAREMGGNLTVYSAGADLGATFTLEIPIPAQNVCV